MPWVSPQSTGKPQSIQTFPLPGPGTSLYTHLPGLQMLDRDCKGSWPEDAIPSKVLTSYSLPSSHVPHALFEGSLRQMCWEGTDQQGKQLIAP